MNWEAVGAIAELIAAIGVIVSLLYLAMQIRQNTASVRASTYQDFTRESADTTRHMVFDGNLLEEFTPILQGARGYDPGQDRRFALIAGLYARNLQFGFLELRAGRIERRQFESYVSYHAESFLRIPAWSQWWKLNRKHFDEELATWIDSLIDI